MNTDQRKGYTVFLEESLADKAMFYALSRPCKTRSKYIRFALINQLLLDGAKLDAKYEPFRNRLIDKELLKGMTPCA